MHVSTPTVIQVLFLTGILIFYVGPHSGSFVAPAVGAHRGVHGHHTLDVLDISLCWPRRVQLRCSRFWDDVDKVGNTMYTCRLYQIRLHQVLGGARVD